MDLDVLAVIQQHKRDLLEYVEAKHNCLLDDIQQLVNGIDPASIERDPQPNGCELDAIHLEAKMAPQDTQSRLPMAEVTAPAREFNGAGEDSMPLPDVTGTESVNVDQKSPPPLPQSVYIPEGVRRLSQRRASIKSCWDLFRCKKANHRSASVRLTQVLQARQPQAETPRFDAFVGIVIVCNSLVMVVQYQWEGYVTGVVLGMEKAGSGWHHAETVFDALEHAFTLFFILELCTRLFLNGFNYFADLGAFFDTALVLSSIIDLYIMRSLGQEANSNVTFMRFARMMRFVRVFRPVRMMNLFSSLRILVKSIHSSGRALVWSMVLLGIIMVISGMLLCQLLTEWIRDVDPDDAKDLQQRKWVFEHYGSSSRAVYTMFEATMSGCWPTYVRPLIEISDWYGIFYVFYVTVVVFAIIRIITALFLKDTLQNAYDDADMMINEKLKVKAAYLEKLAQAFEAMDESGDGTITWDEFEKMLANPQVKAYLSVLDLEVHDTWTLFHLLDGGTGCITYTDFLEGLLRLKGQARSIDLICLQRDIGEIHESLMRLRQHFGIVYSAVGASNGARDAMNKTRRAIYLAKAPQKTSVGL